MKKTHWLILFVLHLMVLLACTSITLAQPSQEKETLVVENTEHVVAYSVKDGNLVITMEAVNDFTDQTAGKWPLVDIMSIEIDRNGNGIVDTHVDVAYGVGDRSICASFLIAVDGSSLCGVFKSKASVEIGFRGTLRQQKPHPVFRFVIPKTEVFSGKGSPGFVFEFSSAEKGRVYYPKRQEYQRRSFAETIRLKID